MLIVTEQQRQQHDQWLAARSRLDGAVGLRRLRLASVPLTPPEPPHPDPPPLDLLGPRGLKFIASYVALKYEISASAILSSDRALKTVAARQEAVFFSWSHTDKSTVQVARFFQRDHTTVLHSIKRHVEAYPDRQWLVDARRREDRSALFQLESGVLALKAQRLNEAAIARSLGIGRHDVEYVMARVYRRARLERKQASQIALIHAVHTKRRPTQKQSLTCLPPEENGHL